MSLFPFSMVYIFNFFWYFDFYIKLRTRKLSGLSRKRPLVERDYSLPTPYDRPRSHYFRRKTGSSPRALGISGRALVQLGEVNYTSPV